MVISSRHGSSLTYNETSECADWQLPVGGMKSERFERGVDRVLISLRKRILALLKVHEQVDDPSFLRSLSGDSYNLPYIVRGGVIESSLQVFEPRH